MRALGYQFRFDQAPAHRPKSIFADPGHRRERRIRRYLLAFMLVALAWGGIIVTDMFTRRPVETRPLPVQQGIVDDTGAGTGTGTGTGTPTPPPGEPTLVPARTTTEPAPPLIRDAAAGAAAGCAPPDSGFMAANAAQDTLQVFAHLPAGPGQERSPFSLSRDCGAIDVLLPEWFAITGPDLRLDIRPLDAEAKLATGDFLMTRGAALQLYPVVGIRPGANWPALLRAFADPDRLNNLTEDLNAAALAVQAEGICFDFGRIAQDRAPAIASFLRRIGDGLRQEGVETCLILNATDESWSAPALRDATDFVVAKVFVEPWAGSPVAATAPQDWFAATAAALAEHFGRTRLVVALGTASHDWVSGTAVPEKIPFGEAMARIGRAGATVTHAPQSQNPHSIFRDRAGRRHHLWMLDAATLYNQLTILADTGIANVAVWDLGSEDMAIWPILADPAALPAGQVPQFTEVLIENYLAYRGEGPFIRVAAPAVTGHREAEIDPATGLITALRYTRLPQPVQMERFQVAAPGKVVLTFDDGPERAFTTPILDALKTAEVPATFFVVGSQIWKNRDLLQRMVAEGHLIGLHSFWHPDMREASPSRNLFELNMTQRAISTATGRASLLFREPYQRTGGPLGVGQATPLWQAQNLGYIYVSSTIAPNDWDQIDRYQITAEVVHDLEESGGNVISLHDGGGNRAEVAAAVPLIIDALRARGYEFISLADLLGLEADSLMPTVERTGQTLVFDMSFRAINSVGSLWQAVFLSAIAIGVLRALAMLFLALRRKRHFTGTLGRFTPPVSVVIPAYNEEDTIIEAVDSVLALNYPNLEVVVVDDGSTDRTIDLLLAKYAFNPSVQIVAQLNQGKWRALNVALETVSSEFVICIDADTRIDARSVMKLIGHFRDPAVGAVAGKVRIANRKGLLPRLQALEYMVAQEIDRRAAEHLNAIMVVPGAIGAWRVSAIHACGGYSSDTLTEDADLTVTMNRKGYTICYEEDAVAVTRAPQTVRQFLAQRARWSLGMLQLARKHRGAVREGRALGWFALPDLIVHGYLLAFLAPIADFLFLTFLLDLGQAAWSGRAPHFDVSTGLLLTYAALPLVDLLVALAAHAFDRTEPLSLVLLSPVQRFTLRPLLYYTAIRAVWRALTGHLVKWTKSHRGRATAGRVAGRVAGRPARLGNAS